MSQAGSALESLCDWAQGLRYETQAYPIAADDKLANLLAVAEKLRQLAANKPLPAPPLDPEVVWRQWQVTNFDLPTLNRAQVRTLCLSEKTALRPQLVRALAGRVDVLLAGSLCLLGIINAYFGQWRGFEFPEEVEALLRAALLRYSGPNPRVQEFKKEVANLFTASAALYLAQKAIAARKSPSEEVRVRGIPATSAFGRAVLSEAAVTWIRDFREANFESDALSRVHYAFAHLLGTETPPRAFCDLVRELILSKWAERLEHVRHDIQTFVRKDSRLGDPRHTESGANWAGVGSEAKDRLLGWLAHEAILFFFNHVLPDSHECRRRKNFWLHYQGKIRNFAVALSAKDFRRLKAAPPSDLIEWCAELRHPTTSAFLMSFEGVRPGHVIVEFSETGHAAHIWSREQFEKDAGRMHQAVHEIPWLKHKAHEAYEWRILHVGERWEERAHDKLSRLGIRP